MNRDSVGTGKGHSFLSRFGWYRKVEKRSKASVEELLAIADRAARHVKHPYIDHAELLYDENGLPK